MVKLLLLVQVEAMIMHCNVLSRPMWIRSLGNIKKHKEHCDVQDLVTYFNISANDTYSILIFSDEVKKKLHECETIKDLFVRLSPYIRW